MASGTKGAPRYLRLVALATMRLKDAEGRANEIANALALARTEIAEIDAAYDAGGTTSDNRLAPIVLAAVVRRRRTLFAIAARLEQAAQASERDCVALRAQVDRYRERASAAQRLADEHQQQADIGEHVSLHHSIAILGQAPGSIVPDGSVGE